MSERYGIDYLLAIQQECVSASQSTEEVLKWVAEQGITLEGLAEFSQVIGNGAGIVANTAWEMGIPPEDLMTALFMSGMEFGIRFEQSKRVAI